MPYQKATHDFTPYLRISIRIQRIIPKTITLTAEDIATICGPDKPLPGNIPDLLGRKRTEEFVKRFYVPLVVVPKATESVSICGNQMSALFGEGDPGFFDTDAPFLDDETLNKSGSPEIIQNVKNGLLVEASFVVGHKIRSL